MELKYHELIRMESAGTRGTFGLKVLVALYPPHVQDGPQIELDLNAVFNDEKVRHMGYDLERTVKDTVMRVALSKMPHIAEETKLQRDGLLAGFGSDAILVEELPNGYCKDYCCAHLPWYVVTTKLGRIKIGWRKRVINIDWSETTGTKTSSELFQSEDVTKETRLIHAWGYDKAREYLGAILTGVPVSSSKSHDVVPT